MSNVFPSKHPLVAHKLAKLRNIETKPKKFRELIREISTLLAYEATADLPVILLTAKGFELAREEVFSKLKVFRLVSKPFSPRELCSLAQMALQERASRPAACTESQAVLS